MSADPGPGWRAWRSRLKEEEEDTGPRTGPGMHLGEPGKYAYAALCAVSLASLFPDQEESAYRTGVVENLVRWLELSDTVMPSMLAFAGGLGAEGTETFARILLSEPLLTDQPGSIMLDLVSFSLKDGSYDARMRVLVSHMAGLLTIPLAELEDAEDYLLECLKDKKEAESEMDEDKRKKKERRKRLKRYLLIGLATVGGGTVIGLTGGLAAPLVATGAAAIIGTAGATALGSAAGAAIIGSLFGAAGAGLVGYKMKKRVGAIEEFEFLPLTEEKQLHITIAITGWLSPGKYGSFTAPWRSLLQSKEQYCLAWESKYLLELGSALDTLWNGLVNMVAQEALKYTILAGIVTALTWPASLLAVAGVIDNPWGVCLHRSTEVGKHLAQILLSRRQGKRPVTLVGFSLGARVIYFCLQEMAKEKDCEGIIEDVVLLGAPVDGDPKSWKQITKVISGRIINGFCRGDWLLRFVYRTASIQLDVAGLQPVCLDDRRMVNVDLSSVVNGHLDYMKQMDTILKAVGLKTRPGLQEEGGLLAGPPPPSEEEKQGMIPDGTASEGPSGLGRPEAGGPKEGEGLNGGEDSWCWEPVSTPGEECEVSPARASKKEETPEIHSSSSSSSPS
uniref:Transmembrane and coiled-coil domains 4 n=1 Tax=Laticauda laticaudata TaxID=8630 RepID=A0A8C5RTV4_LATLA